MKQMFDMSAKLITEQSDEIYGLKTINWENSSWKYLSLIGDEQVISRTPNQTLHGKTDWDGSKVHRNTETWTVLTASQWNSSGISSQDSIRCSSVKKFTSYCWDWLRHQRILQEWSSSCRCSTTSHGDQGTKKKNASQMFNSSVKTVPKVNGTKWRRRWCWHLAKADIQSSVPRVHCPEVSSKAKAEENCRYTIVPTLKRLKLFFAQLLL